MQLTEATEVLRRLGLLWKIAIYVGTINPHTHLPPLSLSFFLSLFSKSLTVILQKSVTENSKQDLILLWPILECLLLFLISKHVIQWHSYSITSEIWWRLLYSFTCDAGCGGIDFKSHWFAGNKTPKNFT